MTYTTGSLQGDLILTAMAGSPYRHLRSFPVGTYHAFHKKGYEAEARPWLDKDGNIVWATRVFTTRDRGEEIGAGEYLGIVTEEAKDLYPKKA